MDHKYINEFDLVERYSMGRLTAEETVEFEEHLVDCLRCIDRLESTTAFLEGLRLVASEQAMEQHSHDPRGLSSYLPHTSSRKLLALAAGVLLLVALAGAVIISNQIRLSSVEVDQARSASAQWERRFEEQRQSSNSAEKKHQESERALTEQVTALRTELENERKQRLEQSAGSKGPQINLPILVLTSARGSVSESTNELTLPNPPGSFVISLTLEGENNYEDYRMTIASADKQVILKCRGLKPNRDNALSVGFQSTYFRPGDYLLELVGVTRHGKTAVVGKYSFRLLKTP